MESQVRRAFEILEPSRAPNPTVCVGVGVMALMGRPFFGSGRASLENTACEICGQLSAPLVIHVCETLAFVRRREIFDFLPSLLAVQICGVFLIDR